MVAAQNAMGEEMDCVASCMAGLIQVVCYN